MQILVAGDVIVDRYITGATERISPEAPVPIVKIAQDYYTLGGAANVANNLISLLDGVSLLGAIGTDANGQQLKNLLAEKNIKHHLYEESSIPTTTKTRVVSRNQQMLRLDREDTFIHSSASLDFVKHVLSSNAIIISDYAKGFCSSDFFKVLFEHKDSQSRVFIDPKGKDWKKYNGAFLVKPNLTELEEVLGKSIANTDAEVATAGLQLIDSFDFENLLVTRGNKGMTLINKSGYKHFPTKNVDVYDVSGAGDTAMAVLVYMVETGSNLDEAIKAANLASGFVVTKAMTYAIQKSELNELLTTTSS